MSLYPPLTQEQLTELNRRISELVTLKTLVAEALLPSMYKAGDEDMLTRAVAELRGRIGRLDLALFQIFGLVHDMKAFNVLAPQASTPVQRKAPPTLDDLEGMFT